MYIFQENGKLVPIDKEKGIDHLGDIVEASILSKNKQYYGDLHNFGHVAFSYVHDPENVYDVSMGLLSLKR